MSEEKSRDTRIIREPLPSSDTGKYSDVLFKIYQALEEKGYDPVQQMAFYLLTGEPAYITAHRNARALTSKIERDEAIEELVRFYVTHHPLYQDKS